MLLKKRQILQQVRIPQWLRRRAAKQDYTGSNPEEVNFFSSIIALRHHKCTIPQFSLNSVVNHAFKNVTIHASSVCLGQFSQFSQLGNYVSYEISTIHTYVSLFVEYLFLRINL